jgi:hypothetical protein
MDMKPSRFTESRLSGFSATVLCNRRLPARHSLLVPVEAVQSGPLDLDLAAVEPILPFVFPTRPDGSATVRRIEQHEGVVKWNPSGEQRAAILDQALGPTKSASVTANDADGADANAVAALT